ncbi:MAG TPA: phosphoglycerate kinase [Dehalococcoidia bacterium]|nr:phosphoglycerate kinase [Dehalococcoidia bacterium]
MDKLTVRDVDVQRKRVLMRVDFNVPMKDGRVADDTRIRGSLHTIRYLMAEEAKIILCSHLGRPGGRVVKSLRMAPVAERLQDLLRGPVKTAPDCVGAEVMDAIDALKPGEVLLLENLRFHAAEEGNGPRFAKALAALGDIYVNDAFSASHRPHASVVGLPEHLPAVAGFLMEKELDMLGRLLREPDHPFALIMGGAKIGDKIGLLENLLTRVDKFLIGGGMANNFLKAEGFPVGDSLVDDKRITTTRRVMEQAQARGVEIILPIDVLVADKTAADARTRAVSVQEVPEGWRIVDIGPKTVEVFKRAIQGCRLVGWNGTLGIAEVPAFAQGSQAIALAMVSLRGAITVAGGGDTVALIQQTGTDRQFTHVSLGGGATLEFLEGRELPGVAALLPAE